MVTRAGGGEACPCFLDKVLCLLFQNGFYKWWRILDHIIAGAWEQGRDPALGSFLTLFVLAEIKMVSYELKTICLGGTVAQGARKQFCALQCIFKMDVTKWIHSDLIETWNLGFGGLFVSANYFGITFFQLVILSESFNRLYGNSVSLYFSFLAPSTVYSGSHRDFW